MSSKINLRNESLEAINGDRSLESEKFPKIRAKTLSVAKTKTFNQHVRTRAIIIRSDCT